MGNEEFEVNNGTCAIVPISSKESKILGDKEYVANKSALKVLEYGCRFYGSSFAGRLEGSKFLLGSCYKLPIILEEETETVFFPTHSYRHDYCSWIALNKIKNYCKQEYDVKVEFLTGKTIVLPLSYDSFETQIFRATKLLLALKQRKQKSRV